MSDSLIAFQPAIEEPSNMMPSRNTSSSMVETCCAVCCHFPRGSVNRRSTYSTECTVSISSTLPTPSLAPEGLLAIYQSPSRFSVDASAADDGADANSTGGRTMRPLREAAHLLVSATGRKRVL